MDKQIMLMLRIKEYFRRHEKTTWGKNQLLKELDDLTDLYGQELEDST